MNVVAYQVPFNNLRFLGSPTRELFLQAGGTARRKFASCDGVVEKRKFEQSAPVFAIF
jgi:hypothetical protein